MPHEIDVVVAAQDNASAVMDRVGHSMRQISDQAGIAGHQVSRMSMSFGDVLQTSAVWAAASRAIDTFSRTISGAAKEMIGFNARLEQVQMGFTTMLGNAEAAKVFIQDMQDFAARTPFRFEDVDLAAKKLLAMGWAARDVIPDLTSIGNAAAALGINKEGIDRITLALGQMNIKAKVSGEEIRQLNEAGISAQKYLADAFNLTGDAFDDLSKTGIKGAEAVRAILKGMADDPKFKDMMDKQAQTMLGLWATVQDNTQMILGAIGQSAFEMTRGVVQNMADMSTRTVDALRNGGISAAIDATFSQEWAERIWKAKTMAEDFFAVCVDGANNASTAMSPLLGGFVDLVETIGSPLIELQRQQNEGWRELGRSLRDFIDQASAFPTALNDMCVSLDDFGKKIAETFPAVETLGKGIVDLSTNIVEWIDQKTGASEAGQVFIDIFNQVGDAAAGAAEKVNRLTLAQMVQLKRDNVVRGGLEDFTARLTARDKDNARSLLWNHKGTAAIDSAGIDKHALDVQRMIEAFNDKVATMFEKLNAKIVAETDGTFATGMLAIKTDVAQMQRDLATEALRLAKEGITIDTSALTVKMAEYADAMTAPIRRAWVQAWADIKNQTALISAQIIGDRRGQADAEYEIAKNAIEKEYEERRKAIAVDKNDEEAKAAAKRWRDNSLYLADQQRRDKKRQADIDDFDAEVEHNEALADLYIRGREEMNKINLKVLENKITYLQREYEAEVDAQNKRELLRQLDAAKKAKQSLEAATDPGKGFESGLKRAYDDFGTWAQNMETLAYNTAGAMQEAFSDFFFDAMTGQLKSLGDYISSFLKSVTRAIANALANAFARRIVDWALPGLIPHASGGPIRYGEDYIAGEDGPELIRNGQVYPADQTRRILSNQAPNVTVNVINQTSQPVQANQAPPKFDGKQYVIDIVLEAYTNNTGGLRTVLAGGRS